MIKVAVAENRKIMREGIRLILEKDADLSVIGAVPTFEHAVSLCEREKPDILLVSAELAEAEIEEGREQATLRAGTRIILLSDRRDGERIAWAIRRGIAGCVCWEISPLELVMAVKGVAMGLQVIQGDALNNILPHLGGSGLTHSPAGRFAPDVPLTKREAEVLREVKLGKENREIAQSLYLSEGTVKNTVSAVLKKLNLKTRVQLAIYAVQNDIGA
ncbi:LuxR C-terminal-related transcriptional regulator [Gorillibacterium sp. sgz500922]|uniref:LuxR C-terminal-related transcriptional regulator n=1 Tax=Gorillibacterium sp. sgz500922 TaxID=3446694 RepID=UPI003F6692C0